MNAKELRQSFLDFFNSKSHKIVPSAPMVIKDDPTLMFTNAGMNQFKEAFLGNGLAPAPRVADTQKCLRVSGKHNDLEEVGHDTYHHTMFEMLGNWSFGDYFKEEAIEWAWEYLTTVLKIDKNRLYITVFGGDASDGLQRDDEASDFWIKWISESRIINGSKKDNFWEMGDQGPCGPCSEIHVDLRSDEERSNVDGKELVNQDHPQVIEIWNLVFIQFNRKADGSLEKLPAQHVDTGMGFERLAMTVQGKKSNYDTDIFQPIIQEIARLTNKKYGTNDKEDIAMRVVADHLRAISFAITDGQLPSNSGAGYVIRRILRRAVRYAYTFLGQESPIIHKLVAVLVHEMGDAFVELKAQRELLEKVILEEENAFLRTLAKGIQILEQAIQKHDKTQTHFDGNVAFELYDTYGFPLDLTELILKENQLQVDKVAFDQAMEQQKQRSRNDAAVETDDWTILNPATDNVFVGYDQIEAEAQLIRYRKTTVKGKIVYHLVFNRTPFYGESGGQIGDQGKIEIAGETITVFDTQKEHGLMIHYTSKLPQQLEGRFVLRVDVEKRQQTASHHSATHLLHYALRQVLGTHVEQKGSYVTDRYLRFDFSHFQKLNPEEIAQTESLVNRLIRQNEALQENRNASMAEAQEMGAMALFGEKYGDSVRVIRFGASVELCGGTHAKATGDLGLLKITIETSVAAGVRRIEAVVADAAEQFVNDKLSTLKEIDNKLKSSTDIVKSIDSMMLENAQLKKQIDQFQKMASANLKSELKSSVELINGINFIAKKVQLDDAGIAKDIAFQLKGEIDHLFLLLAADIQGKPNITIMISDDLVSGKNLHAGNLVRELAKLIQGGGGGQAFFATAGGKDVSGLDKVIERAMQIIKN
ncbi:MAG: alanine--tRNA ligase [Bacteroidales bacterium]|nr:alanine--tRNA ligase [Bacteroidales bacterium]